MATRWGIVSAALISSDFVNALNTLPKEEHQVVAIGASSLQRAKDFATKHNIPKAYGSYEELAKDKNVEIAYIGVVHPEHFRLAKMMLEAGKHVLVEKPMCMNARETKELTKLAQQKKLFLMEAIWSRFFPVNKKLREELNKGTIGDIVHVSVTQGFAGQHIDRMTKKHLGGGTILDTGVYTVNALLYVLGEKPQKIVAVGTKNEEGCDLSVAASFLYSKGRTANFAITSVAPPPCELIITGTKGHLKVLKPSHCPTTLVTPDEIFEFPIPEASTPFNFVNSSGLRYEAMEVRECLKKGLTQCPLLPHKDSETISEILDELRRQVGVTYPADKV